MNVTHVTLNVILRFPPWATGRDVGTSDMTGSLKVHYEVTRNGMPSDPNNAVS